MQYSYPSLPAPAAPSLDQTFSLEAETQTCGPQTYYMQEWLRREYVAVDSHAVSTSKTDLFKDCGAAMRLAGYPKISEGELGKALKAVFWPRWQIGEYRPKGRNGRKERHYQYIRKRSSLDEMRQSWRPAPAGQPEGRFLPLPHRPGQIATTSQTPAFAPPHTPTTPVYPAGLQSGDPASVFSSPSTQYGGPASIFSPPSTSSTGSSSIAVSPSISTPPSLLHISPFSIAPGPPTSDNGTNNDSFFADWAACDAYLEINAPSMQQLMGISSRPLSMTQEVKDLLMLPVQS